MLKVHVATSWGQVCAGILRPCLNDASLKTWIYCDLEKHGLTDFQHSLKIRVYSQDMLKTYPWRCLLRRPLGAATPGGGVFSKYFNKE
jgi:hypothetical protein